MFSDVEHIRSITESFLESYSRKHARLMDVDLCGIRMEETHAMGSIADAEDLFSSDIKRLFDVYHSSTSDVQSVLASIIDLVFVRLNDDAKGGKVENLLATRETLRDCLYKIDEE